MQKRYLGREKEEYYEHMMDGEGYKLGGRTDEYRVGRREGV